MMTRVQQPQRTIKQRKRLIDEIGARLLKASKVNVFADFLPQRRKKSQKLADDAKHNEMMQQKLTAVNDGGEDTSALASKPDDDKPEHVQSELPRQWYMARSPCGGIRVGDVQMSFEIVREDALKENEKLQAGKGRSGPQELPSPERPSSS